MSFGGKPTQQGRRQKAVSLMAFVFLTLTLLACAESTTVTPGPYAATGGNAQPPVVTSSALQPTLEKAQVDLYLAAVQEEQAKREAERRLEILHTLMTATAEVVHATATRQAVDATATAEIVHATATAIVWQTTVEAGKTQATATAQAVAAQATQTAQAEAAYAMATAQVRQEQATATAQAHREQATATAQAAIATATVEAVAFQQRTTATAAAWSVQATATTETAQAVATKQAADAQRAHWASERERITHPVRAYGPWVLVTVVAIVVVVGLVRMLRVAEMRARVVKVGPQEREIVLLNGKVLQPARGHLPILDYEHPHESQAAGVSDEDQRATTMRAQTVELMRASHPPVAPGSTTKTRQSKGSLTPGQAKQLMARTLAKQHPTTYGQVQVVSSDRVRKWLDDVRPQAYHDALTQDVTD